MAIGPLESFVFPSVIVKTVTEAPGTSAAGEIRYPAIIGTAAEEVRVSDFEMVRGSSAVADNLILDEDISSQFDGTNGNFTVANFPIVTGNGTGKAATSPLSVIVTINGESVAVNSVDGLNGEVTLITIPLAEDTVRANYYFKRRDTYVESESVASQADGTNTIFKISHQRIVRGDNGGVSATDDNINGSVTILYDPDPNNPGDEFERTVRIIKCEVNGSDTTISELDGASGTFTLSTAPGASDTVAVWYFTSLWQDTYDILPAATVNRMIEVGLSQDTSDFSIGQDCVLAGENELHWGHSKRAAQGIYTAGSTPLEDNLIVSLTDNRVYGRVATPLEFPVDGSGNPIIDADGNVLNDDANNNQVFTLPTAPVDGSGTAVATENPSDFTAYVGSTFALAKAAGAVTVISVSGNDVTIPLADIPTQAGSGKVYVTYYENLLVDDKWTLTNRVPGAAAVGKYTITSNLTGTSLEVTQSGGTVSPVYAGAGAFNVETNPLRSQVEQVTVTFDGLGGFTVTSLVGPAFTTAGLTGSETALNANKGVVGKTYIDPKTGFRIAFSDNSGLFNPGVGDTLIYDMGDPTTAVNPNKFYITASASIVMVIPGINITMPTTDGVLADNTDDTVIIDTYNKSGNEPEVGDIYYVTFDKAKTDYTSKFYTAMRQVIADYGPIDVTNRITVAANLAFLNGARAVAIKQILKVVGGTDASVQSYIDGIDSFNEPLPNGTRPSMIQPLSTDPQVHAYLKTSNAIQSSLRYRNERTSVIGFAIGTTSDSVIQQINAIKSEKVTAVYPDGAVIGITDAFGNEVEYLLDGSMIAVAVAGRDVSQVTDIATSLTNSTIVGFKRLFRRLDNVTAGLVANSGCTVLEQQDPVIRILMYLTTDLSNALTRNPRIVEVKHWIQQGTRRVLRRYIGMKNLVKVQPQVSDTLSSYFSALKRAEIISNFTGISVTQNDSDPSTLDVEAYYSPVFPLNWILVTLNLRSSV